MSSARYRRQVKYIFINKCWRMYCRRRIQNNQVLPMSQLSASENDLQSVR